MKFDAEHKTFNLTDDEEAALHVEDDGIVWPLDRAIELLDKINEYRDTVIARNPTAESPYGPQQNQLRAQREKRIAQVNGWQMVVLNELQPKLSPADMDSIAKLLRNEGDR